MIFDDNYIALLKEVLERGETKRNRTGVETLSLFTRVLDAGDLGHTGVPISNLRKIYWRGALIETLWFLGLHANDEKYKNLPITNIQYLHDQNVKYWDAWADEYGNLGPVYGAQLTHWNGEFNQIQYIIEELRKNPDSRRLVTTLWNQTDIPKMALPPCHYGMEFYSSQNEDGSRTLHTTWHQRSADLPIGIPYNVLQYTIINKLVAYATGHRPGRVTGVLGDCHIYKDQIPMVQEMIRRYDSGEVNQCTNPILRLSDDIVLSDGVFDINKTKLDGSDFELLNYNPLDAIKIPVAV